MKNLLLVLCIAYLSISCGSKKEFIRLDTVENIRTNEQLHAEFYRATRLLEFLDMKIRRVETRDSSGNVRIETEAEISKKTDRKDLDTTKITSNKKEEREKVVNQDAGKERSGVMEDWVWIVGSIAMIVVALVVGIYFLKR